MQTIRTSSGRCSKISRTGRRTSINAGPNDPSQETEIRKAAEKVIAAFNESRKEAAIEKSQQAYTNLGIFAREMAATRGDPDVQATVDNILGAGGVEARKQKARKELKYLGDEATIEEGVAQVVAAQVVIVRAKRDVARSVKAWQTCRVYQILNKTR